MNLKVQWLVRKASISDATAIASCVKEAYKPYLARMDKLPGPMLVDYNKAIATHQVWVAVAGESRTIIGGLVLIPDSTFLLLDNIFVHPNYQGFGIGKALLNLAESEAIGQGYEEIRLYTHEKMVENVTLYDRLGWIETHRRCSDGYNRVFFRKPLFMNVSGE